MQIRERGECWPLRRLHVTAFISAACDSARKRAGPGLTAPHTARALRIRRRDTPTREERALQAASMARCSATRVGRRAYGEIDRTVQRHGMVRAERNAHGERAAYLPRESHDQLCATIAMGRLGSEQSAESSRLRPRLAEVHLREGARRWSRRSNGRARTRPELNLKFTDGDRLAQSRRAVR